MPRPAYVRIVKLRQWFPADDPLAAPIARLCILREDLLLEMHGVYNEDVRDLDDGWPSFRRMYFLRNLVRTQSELSRGIHTLVRHPEFKKLLDKEPTPVRKQFRMAVRAISRAHQVVRDVRNDICGHVLERAVQEGLERINHAAWGFLDLGKTADYTHYKFVEELTAELLLKDVSDEERRAIQSSKWAAIADCLPAFPLIERCLLMYVNDRKLWS
jgi:hypothetical protein